MYHMFGSYKNRKSFTISHGHILSKPNSILCFHTGFELGRINKFSNAPHIFVNILFEKNKNQKRRRFFPVYALTELNKLRIPIYLFSLQIIIQILIGGFEEIEKKKRKKIGRNDDRLMLSSIVLTILINESN